MCPLINYTLATDENVRNVWVSGHDAITFQLLEMSSITTPNQKQFGILAQGSSFKGVLNGVLGEKLAILRAAYYMKKNQSGSYV